jgi:hypothetical protein
MIGPIATYMEQVHKKQPPYSLMFWGMRVLV